MFQYTLGKSTSYRVSNAAVILTIVVYHLCLSLLGNFSWKIFFLVISEIVRPLVKTLTPDVLLVLLTEIIQQVFN